MREILKTTQFPGHSADFKRRRFLNWFFLGISYALLYMGRYNLTVAKTSLESLMTKEDFGVIFGAGTFTYAISMIINGPIIDRFGGRLGILLALSGSAVANLAMGIYTKLAVTDAAFDATNLRWVFSVLYAVNMYFQCFGALSIIKVNSHWFHVKERGGFSGIFGAMISSGIFLAFTVNSWILDLATGLYPGSKVTHVVFFAPAFLLCLMFLVEFFVLRNKPGHAGFNDFDTGDASSGESDDPIPTGLLLKRIFTNPIIMTIAAVEFCTGVLRNGVMHWFPIYAKEVWNLSSSHPLRNGSWSETALTFVLFGIAAVSALIAVRARGGRKAFLITFATAAFLAPFFQAGWGGILFVAGVVGGNVAGWVSDLFFGSRRAPSVAGLYALLALSTVGMIFVLSPPKTVLATASAESGLKVGDQILAVAGKDKIDSWVDVMNAIACFQPACKESIWDEKNCVCVSDPASRGKVTAAPNQNLTVQVLRDGKTETILAKDPAPLQRAGDRRTLKISPVLPISPWFLGGIVFVMSLCVIGAHGLLSGSASMDFAGRRGAATAAGVIDGFVYIGTAIQSVSLGYLTTYNWAYWPIFLAPFGVVGFLLLLRIWNAMPAKHKSAH